MKSWLFDEYRQGAIDYSDADQAAIYDHQHTKFRNYANEFNEMLSFIEIPNAEEKDLIDLGCGTGAITCFAADYFRNVFAVDVSEAMIKQVRKKLSGDKQNVTFVKAGFLTYEHKASPVDLVVTKAALHHLPDFWKQIALLRINRMLKQDGLLYLHDVVFRFDLIDYSQKLDQWITDFGKAVGEDFRREAEIHVREEYSTFGWIMDRMLANAGFSIEKTKMRDSFVTEYVCRKEKDVNAEATA